MLEATQRDLRFQRRDLHVVGATNRGCLRLLPGKKAKLKCVVGDVTGVVQSFALGKNDDIKPEFATNPPLPKPIGSIDVYQDQVFFCGGDRVMGVTKKGKPFFVFDTHATEALTQLKISTPYFYSVGEFTVTGYQEASERGFTIAPDKVNDMAILPRETPGSFDIFLACQDRCLRILRDGKFVQELPLAGPGMSLAWFDHPGGPRDLLCATASGTLHSFGWTGNGLVKKFTRSSTSKNAAVPALCTSDITKDGFQDVILGHDDGTVELLSYELNPENTPVNCWKGAIPECITGMACGTFTNADRDDIVLSSFSGKILCFAFDASDAKMQAALPEVLTSQQAALPAVGALQAQRTPQAAAAASDEPNVKQKLDETNDQIQRLGTLLESKKREFAAITKSAPNAPMRAVSTGFAVRESFSLDEDGSVRLGIELDTPVDFVILSTAVSVELTDVTSEGITCSQTPPNCSPNSTKMSAVYRCIDAAACRMRMQCRPTEGVYGPITATIVPRIEPRAAVIKTFAIRPLCLHQRAVISAEAPDPVVANAETLSSLVITGAFSARDAHAWIFHLLPDVPEVLIGDEGKISFKNVFVGSVLHARYRKGEVELHSDNVSTLAIAKEFITKEATARKIAIRLGNVTAKHESVLSTLALLHTKLQHQATVARHVKLIEGLREIEVQEQSVSFLTEECQQILANAKQLEQEHREQPKRVQYLTALVTRLYQDKQALRGESVSPLRVQQLQQLMQNYDYRQMIDLFSAPSS